MREESFKLTLADYPEPCLEPVAVSAPKMTSKRQAVVVGALRTPIGKLLGSLSSLSAIDLGVKVVSALLEETGIPPQAVEQLILGNVLSAGLGQNPARQVALGAGLPVEVQAFSVNMVCASGLQAIVLGAQAICSGQAEVVVAGGMESMSRAPYLLDRVRKGYRMGDGTLTDSMIFDGLWDAKYNFHMGITAELTAAKYKISREEQDRYALESHQKAVSAQRAGKFAEEIIPVMVKDRKKGDLVIDKDESPRSDTSLEKLSKLKPVFLSGGTVTAGNAPGVNDGAAAVMLMSYEKAKELGLTPIARIVDWYCAGLDPAWVMLTPIPAVRGLVARNDGFGIDDVAVYELNEAFAVQALAVTRVLGIDKAKVNPNGGAVALGHPIGASGARILVTLLGELKRRGSGIGIASLCLGGGNGLAVAVETV